ncbi:MAG TPA: CoA transferase [Acidimicrobiales bacterium]|nr:CoA transferase [Acidimicrobiales bacterium]
MGALDGVRVVDAGVLVQAPQAAALLGQFGAEVIKVEFPGLGDHSRWLPVRIGDTRSAFFAGNNRGKRSITVNLNAPEGREVFLRLVERADVLLTNFSPGRLEAWGLGPEVLSARNPRLVHGIGSAYGALGPEAHLPGADLGGQARGGLIASTGVDGGDPTPVGAAIADHISSQHLAAGVLAALLARERTGHGQRVEVSLLGGQVWAQATEITAFLMTGEDAGRPNFSHPLVAGIYGIFPTSDGWVAVIGVTPPYKHAFFEAVGRADLIARFGGPAPLTAADKAEVFAELGHAFRRRTTAEWCKVLDALDVRYAPVQGYAEVAADPQVWANGYLVATEDGPAIGMPVRFSATPADTGTAAPELGQHTEEVLLEHGYSWDDIAVLRDAGAI